MTVSFTVYGIPQPAGSKRGFQRGGRVIVTDANPKARPWKALVTDAAIQAMSVQAETPLGNAWDWLRSPLEGPLSVELTFYVARPKGHYGKNGVRPSAPRFPAVRPDVLKLARGCEDAMSGVVYRDDSQIVDERLRKRYGEPARCEITITNAEEEA